jgi:hypothetical protein
MNRGAIAGLAAALMSLGATATSVGIVSSASASSASASPAAAAILRLANSNCFGQTVSSMAKTAPKPGFGQTVSQNASGTRFGCPPPGRPRARA